MSTYLSFATTLAKKAGDIMRSNFSLGMKKDWKDNDSPVTVTDNTINQLVIDEVHKKYPTHSVLAEEGSSLKDSAEYTWVCDPIDGTIPFSHGIPTCVFSLALVKDGNPIIAAIYDPFMDRLFTAEKEKGAYCNGEKIHVSMVSDLSHALVGGGLWSYGPYNLNPVMIELDKEAKLGLITLNSVIYEGMLVASGEIACTFYASVFAHDVATLQLLVEEAGGKVTDLFGKDQRYDGKIQGAIISNGVLHKKLVHLTKKALEK